jgi:hypothetical protein
MTCSGRHNVGKLWTAVNRNTKELLSGHRVHLEMLDTTNEENENKSLMASQTDFDLRESVDERISKQVHGLGSQTPCPHWPARETRRPAQYVHPLAG